MSDKAAIQWLDSTDRYGFVSRLFHWSMAALLLWQLTGMALKLLLGRTPVVAFFVKQHATIGTVLFALVVLRVAWTLVNRHRRPDHGVGIKALAAKLGHAALYALMLLVPALALLRGWAGTRPLEVFGLTVFSARPEGTQVDWAIRLADSFHGEAGWVLSALIAGHLLMVAVHEGLWRDGTLSRMAQRQRVRGTH